MASKKKKAASAGAGALAAGKAAKDNPYVQRLMEDDDLRENLDRWDESRFPSFAICSADLTASKVSRVDA